MNHTRVKSLIDNRLGGLNGILFSIYLYIVISLNWNYAKSPLGIFLFIIIAFASPYLLKLIQKIHISKVETTKQQRLKWWTFVSLISLAVLLIWYFAFYPGAYVLDSIHQYEQALSGNYNDWHPVLHTLLFVTLPLKMTGNWGGSIVLWQMLLFAPVIGYISETCYEFCGKVFSIIITALILLNVSTGIVSVWLWKDAPFAYASAVAMIFAVRIYFSKDSWSDSWFHVTITAVFLCLSAILRHNGILFAVPLLFFLAFTMKKKNYLKLVLFTLCLFFVVKGPLYSALKVGTPGERHSEAMGLPVSIIGGCVVKSPDRLDEDIKEFAYAIADKEIWEEYYESGSFNSIKFTYANRNVIEETPVLTTIGYAVKCFTEDPKDAIKVAIDATNMVWAVGGDVGDMKASMPADKFGAPFETRFKEIKALRLPLYLLIGLETYSIFSFVFGYIGNTIMIVMAFIFARCNLKLWKEWKKIFLCLPLFIYDFGTMLLLTGFDWRLFYINYLVYPLLILLLIANDPSKEMQASPQIV